MVNLVLYALCENANTNFHWIDIRGPGPTPSETDPPQLGWIAPGHLWEVEGVDALVADHAKANAAVFELIRSDEPPETLARLADFLRLPRTVQRVLAELSVPGSSGLVAVANVDRISGAVPDAALSPILDAFDWLGCSLFVGCAESAPEVRRQFGRVVRVEGDAPQHWRDASVELEAGAPIASLGLGERRTIPDLPFLARVFRRAHDSP